MTFTRLLAVFFLVSFLPLVGMAEGPVVLSMSAVPDLTPGVSRATATTLRPQILTRLIRDYDCFVLSRDNAESLATEARLARLAALTKGLTNNASIMAADYAVWLHLRPDAQGKGVQAFMLYQDLRDESAERQKETWQIEAPFVQGQPTREYGQVVTSIVEHVAKTLSIPRRGKQAGTDKKDATTSHVWAVLPIADIDCTTPPAQSFLGKRYQLERSIVSETQLTLSRTMLRYNACTEENILKWTQHCVTAKDDLKKHLAASRPDERRRDNLEITQAIELTLQKNLPEGRLVDRAYLDRTLAEMKLHTLAGANESSAGAIGRVVGAQRVIMGCIARQPSGIDLSLFVVDAGSSVVLAAEDAFCKTPEELNAAAGSIAARLVTLSLPSPPVRTGTLSQRSKEAAFYASAREFIGAGTDASRLARLSSMEAAYLLMFDQPRYLATEIVPQIVKLVDGDPIRREGFEIAREAMDLLEQVLGGQANDQLFPGRLLILANGYLCTFEYEKARELAARFMKEYPNESVDWGKCTLADAEFRLGNHKRAKELTQDVLKSSSRRSMGTSGCVWEHAIPNRAAELLWRTAMQDDVRDTDVELYALRKILESGCPYYDRGARDDEGLWMPSTARLRLQQLLREKEGPQAAIDMYERIRSRQGGYSHADNRPYARLASECLLDLGKLDEAAAILQGLKDEPANKKLQELSQSTGQTLVKTVVPEKPRTGAEICEFPKKHKIYCYPVKGVDTNIVAGIAQRVGKWFGTTVVVQPALPLPTNTFLVKGEYYEFHDLSRQLIEAAKVPDDAVLVYFVTGAPFIPHWSSWIYIGRSSPWCVNPIAVSHYELGAYRPGQNIDGLSEALASDALKSLVESVIIPLGTDWTGKSRWDTDDCPHEKHSECQRAHHGSGPTPQLCAACAVRYQKGFDACSKALQAFVHRKGSFLSYAGEK